MNLMVIMLMGSVVVGAPQEYEVIHASQKTDPFSPYGFSYTVQDPGSGVDIGHSEDSSGGSVHGQYTVLSPDEQRQTVQNHAGHHRGFQPTTVYQIEGDSHQQRSTYDPVKFQYFKNIEDNRRTLPAHQEIIIDQPIPEIFDENVHINTLKIISQTHQYGPSFIDYDYHQPSKHNISNTITINPQTIKILNDPGNNRKQSHLSNYNAEIQNIKYSPLNDHNIPDSEIDAYLTMAISEGFGSKLSDISLSIPSKLYDENIPNFHEDLITRERNDIGLTNKNNLILMSVDNEKQLKKKENLNNSEKLHKNPLSIYSGKLQFDYIDTEENILAHEIHLNENNKGDGISDMSRDTVRSYEYEYNQGDGISDMSRDTVRSNEYENNKGDGISDMPRDTVRSNEYENNMGDGILDMPRDSVRSNEYENNTGNGISDMPHDTVRSNEYENNKADGILDMPRDTVISNEYENNKADGISDMPRDTVRNNEYENNKGDGTSDMTHDTVRSNEYESIIKEKIVNDILLDDDPTKLIDAEVNPHNDNGYILNLNSDDSALKDITKYGSSSVNNVEDFYQISDDTSLYDYDSIYEYQYYDDYGNNYTFSNETKNHSKEELETLPSSKERIHQTVIHLPLDEFAISNLDKFPINSTQRDQAVTIKRDLNVSNSYEILPDEENSISSLIPINGYVTNNDSQNYAETSNDIPITTEDYILKPLSSYYSNITSDYSYDDSTDIYESVYDPIFELDFNETEYELEDTRVSTYWNSTVKNTKQDMKNDSDYSQIKDILSEKKNYESVSINPIEDVMYPTEKNLDIVDVDEEESNFQTNEPNIIIFEMHKPETAEIKTYLSVTKEKDSNNHENTLENPSESQTVPKRKFTRPSKESTLGQLPERFKPFFIPSNIGVMIDHGSHPHRPTKNFVTKQNFKDDLKL